MAEVSQIAKKAEKAVEAIVEPIITKNGYEYVDTEIKKTSAGTELIIYADKTGGLMLEDCEIISNLIDSAIELQDPIEESYFLCVSSPGLDRTLKKPKDFAKSLGKKVDVKLYRSVDGKKLLTGVLKSYDDIGFALDNGATFEYKDVAAVKLHIEI